MSPTLRPSSIKVDQPYNYLKRELEKIKFAEQSFFNQLKKLILYLALLFQEKSDHTKNKNITDNKKLISSLKAFTSLKENNLMNLSKIDEIKLNILKYLKQKKFQPANLRGKLKRKSVNTVNSESEAVELEERAEVRKKAKKMIDILHELTAARPAEHVMKLQESYALLKMQPRAVDESEDDFQDRLLQHTTKAISTAPDTEDDEFKYTNAQEYLDKYSRPAMEPVDIVNGVNHLENENVSSLKMSNRK